MKQILIQLAIMVVVFMLLWIASPFIMAALPTLPAWLKDANVQFLFGLLMALFAAFNPATSSVIHNRVTIKGNGNQVVQGRNSASANASVHNKAAIRGDKNQVRQG